MKDTYLYFAGIDGGGGAADGTGQAYLGKAKNLRGVLPISTTTTGITHANTTTTTGHRCKLIARACAYAANATPHVNGIVDVLDHDNTIFYDGIKEISNDSGFDMVVTLDA